MNKAQEVNELVESFLRGPLRLRILDSGKARTRYGSLGYIQTGLDGEGTKLVAPELMALLKKWQRRGVFDSLDNFNLTVVTEGSQSNVVRNLATQIHMTYFKKPWRLTSVNVTNATGAHTVMWSKL